MYICRGCRVTVCCGALYKCESNDLILIDVSKFKPCQQRNHCNLAHLTAAARDAEMTDSSRHIYVSASYSSTSSLSTQDGDVPSHCGLKPCDDTKYSSLPLSASADGKPEDEDDDEYDNDDTCSVLQTDESMDALQDTDDEEADMLPASAVSGNHRSILSNLLWNNRPFSKSDNREDHRRFVWSKMQPQSVNMWPSTHALSKPSPVKVVP